MKVLFARLDDVRQRRLALDQRGRPFRGSGVTKGPDVRIVADGRVRARRPEAPRRPGLPCLGSTAGESSRRGDAGPAVGPDLRERPGPSNEVRVEVEGVAGAGLGGAAHDEGQAWSAARSRRTNPEVDAVVRETRLPAPRRCRPGEMRDTNARPANQVERKPDRDVVRRSAEHGVVGVRLPRIGNEVDQRFAGNEYHEILRPLNGLLRQRIGGPGRCIEFRRRKPARAAPMRH